MRDYSNRYMATCVPGLEFAAADEIREKLRNVNNMALTRGKVTFDCTLADMDANGLKCADNVYKLYRVFPVGPHKSDLAAVGESVRDIDFGMDTQPPYRVIVSASRSGRHTYSRYDAARRIENSLVSTGRYIPGGSDSHDLAIRADITGGSCSVYKQLTSSEIRFRGNAFHSVPGGIRPTIAHALVRLSRPRNGDVFYDPFCGAGTIPFERSYYKSKKIFASDYNSEVVEVARMNLKQAAVVFQADAVSMKMKDRSVNKVVTNMPWGKQVEVGDIDKLYRDFLNGLRRILAPGGIAVALTDRVESLESSCEMAGLTSSRLTVLSLHGLNPVVFMICRCEEKDKKIAAPTKVSAIF